MLVITYIFMGTIEAGKLKKGDFINHQNDIWKVVKTEFYNPGKGSALMKCVILALSTQKQVAYTFKSAETVETVEISGANMQYLYNDGENYAFMDGNSFEQYEVPATLVGDVGLFMKEGDEYYVYLYDNKPVDINLGASVTLKVVKAEEVAKGNTVNNIQKEVELETGATMMVPAFIRVGDMISVNPQTAEYRGRVN
jgi:elongation factor P